MDDCKYYHYVVADPWGNSYDGPGCLATGGHCVPSRCPGFEKKENDGGQDMLDGCLDAGDFESWFDTTRED
jgi:hypothetical protein